MKRLFVLSAVALSVALLASQDVAAQRRGGGGGGAVRPAVPAFGGASVRITGVPRAAAPTTSLGAHTTITRSPRVVHRPVVFGHGANGLGHRAVETPRAGNRRHALRAGGFGQGWGMVRHAGWRGHHRRWWGVPVASVGIGAGYYYDSYPAYSDCLAWDGYAWVDACSGNGAYDP